MASIAVLPGVHPAGHREVDSFQPDASGEAQGCGVAGDQQSVPGHLRHHRQAGFRDEMRGVLAQLAAFDQRGDRRVPLHCRDDLLRPSLLGGELRQLQHDPDGDGVEVGVDEPAAVDAAGASDDLDVDPSRSRTPKRSSMTCFGSAKVSLTPRVKFLAFGVP